MILQTQHQFPPTFVKISYLVAVNGHSVFPCVTQFTLRLEVKDAITEMATSFDSENGLPNAASSHRV